MASGATPSKPRNTVSSRTEVEPPSNPSTLAQENTRPRKRRRYVREACNRCKKQKIRCDGQLPCGQCEARNTQACSYGSEGRPSHQAPVISCCDAPDCKGTCTNARKDKRGEEAAISWGETNFSSLTMTPSISQLPDIAHKQMEKLDLLLERTHAIQEHFSVPIAQRKPRYSSPVTGRSHPDANFTHRTAGPSAEICPSKPPLPLFQGPTSPSFCISLIEMNLKEIERGRVGTLLTSEDDGATTCTAFSVLQGEIIDDDHSDIAESSANDSHILSLPSSVAGDGNTVSLYPFQDIYSIDAERLVGVYDELIGSMFPILDPHALVLQTREIYSYLAPSPTEPRGGEKTRLQMDKNDVNILKMVLAIAMLAEGKDSSALALELIKSLEDEVQSKIWSTEVDLKGLQLLILISLFHSVNDDWRLAWRVIGNVARIILELGLHLRPVLTRAFVDKPERVHAINTFWSAFLLDRQLSYALGLPMTMQDIHLEFGFPPPINAPYLNAMIQYARLGTKACDSLWKATNSKLSSPAQWNDSLGYFQYQLEQWQKGLPGELQFTYDDTTSSRGSRLVRTILYLRYHQLQILISRPFLCSRSGPAADAKLWTTSVNVACDTIQVLAHLDKTSELYRLQPSQFNYFLLSALGVVLLLLARKPFTGSSSEKSDQQIAPSIFANARRGALVALSLLRDLSQVSYCSGRLWKRASSLGYRLNLHSAFPLSSPHYACDDTDAADEVHVGNSAPQANKELAETELPTSAPAPDHATFVEEDAGPDLDIGLDLPSPSSVTMTDIEMLLGGSLFTPGLWNEGNL